MNRIALYAAVAALSLPAFARAATYELDGVHSSASFRVRHLAVAWVRGEFQKLSGTVSYDPKNVAATTVSASIDVSTISTRNADRDGHLKSPDFFDVAKFPTMTFKSKKAEGAPGKLKVTGDLTLHGVTKEVVLDVEGPSDGVKDPWGNTKLGATATTKINRKDFGLTWNKALETGGVLVGEEVEITLDLEAAPAKAPEAAPAAKGDEKKAEPAKGKK
jgi:polyisoprenoid-binding protein YceI